MKIIKTSWEGLIHNTQKTWNLNKGKGTNQIAVHSDLGGSDKKAIIESELPYMGYDLKSNPSHRYLSNQCVKYSDLELPTPPPSEGYDLYVTRMGKGGVYNYNIKLSMYSGEPPYDTLSGTTGRLWLSTADKKKYYTKIGTMKYTFTYIFGTFNNVILNTDQADPDSDIGSNAYSFSVDACT